MRERTEKKRGKKEGDRLRERQRLRQRERERDTERERRRWHRVSEHTLKLSEEEIKCCFLGLPQERSLGAVCVCHTGVK